MAIKSRYIKPQYTVAKPYACRGTEALLVYAYKMVSVNNEFHIISLSDIIEVLVLASALVR